MLWLYVRRSLQRLLLVEDNIRKGLCEIGCEFMGQIYAHFIETQSYYVRPIVKLSMPQTRIFELNRRIHEVWYS